MERSSFFNARETSPDVFDRVYKAEEFAEYFAKFISNGVYPNPSTNLQLVQNDTPDMTTVLMPGAAFINGYLYVNDAKKTFSHKVADGVLNRKDAIFVRFDNAGRMIGSVKMEGTPGVDAVVPSVVRTPDYYDLCVSVVNIPAGATKITQDMIEDTRMDTDVCGIVHAVVNQIDTRTLYLQVQKDLENFQVTNEAEFNEWFESIKGIFSGDVAGNIMALIEELGKQVVYKYSATLKLDAWEGGGPYSQKVKITPIDGGPTVKSTFKFYSPPMCGTASNSETREKLLETLSLINNSDYVLGEGEITVNDVQEKPTTDIEVIWTLKEGGA